MLPALDCNNNLQHGVKSEVHINEFETQIIGRRSELKTTRDNRVKSKEKF